MSEWDLKKISTLLLTVAALLDTHPEVGSKLLSVVPQMMKQGLPPIPDNSEWYQVVRIWVQYFDNFGVTLHDLRVVFDAICEVTHE